MLKLVAVPGTPMPGTTDIMPGMVDIMPDWTRPSMDVICAPVACIVSTESGSGVNLNRQVQQFVFRKKLQKTHKTPVHVLFLLWIALLFVSGVSHFRNGCPLVVCNLRQLTLQIWELLLNLWPLLAVCLHGFFVASLTASNTCIGYRISGSYVK